MKFLVKYLPLLLCGCLASAVLDGADPEVSQKSSKQQTADSTANQTLDSVFIVKSVEGSGSAFITNLGKENVIVTNGHVFFKMNTPEIYDIKGRKYEITKVVASKTRDLVLLSFVGSDCKVLEIEPDITKLPINTPVIAYGNSLGDSVIVPSTTGSLNGIGPETIEVDSGFVPGNSGGPVVAKKSGKIVGVATYMRIVKPDVTVQGSRYETTGLCPTVRRFAVRIDNLEPDDLQEIDQARLNADRKVFTAFEQKYSLLLDNFKGKNFDYKHLIKDLKACCEVMGEAESYDWSCEYLKHEFQEKEEVVLRLLEISEMTDLLEVSKIQKLWAHNLNDVTVTKVKPFTVPCFYCLGAGIKSQKYDNPNYSRQNGGPQTIIETKKCPICLGNKRKTVSDVTEIYQLSPALEQKFLKLIPIGNHDFCDFVIGGDMNEQLEVGNGYYKNPKNLVYTYNNLFGKTMLFRGSHCSNLAMSTELMFMFGRLVKVEMVLGGNYSKKDVDGLIGKFYSQNFDLIKKENYNIQYEMVDTAENVPVDGRGIPLVSLGSSVSSATGNQTIDASRLGHAGGGTDVKEFLVTKGGGNSWDNNSKFAPAPSFDALIITANVKGLPTLEKLDK